MLRLRYVTIDCVDSKLLAPFWAEVLGWDVVYDEADGALVGDPAGVDPRLFLQPVPEPKVAKNRAHIDLEAVDFDAEQARLVELGATVISSDDRDPSRRSSVLADPQGNEFCLTEAPPPA